MEEKQNSKYNALSKAWRSFVSYDVLPKPRRDVWDNKLFDIEGNEINLNKLYQFIEAEFEKKDVDNIYKKAKVYLEKSEERKEQRDKKEFKEFSKQINENVLKLSNYIGNVEKFYETQPFFYDKSKAWWFWNKEEFKYEFVDETDLMNALDTNLNFGGETVTTMIKSNYLEAFKRVGRKKHPKESPKEIIQFRNMLFDYKTEEMKEATPDLFCCNPIPWDLGERSETPTMDKIFEEWVGEENVDLLYDVIAYCTIQDYPLARIFVLIGSGSNGKTCFLNLLKKFIGVDNCSSSELDRLIDRFGSTCLYKKLVCMVGETNFDTMKKTSFLKRMSGNDQIEYEFKNKNLFSDRSYAKLVIATNTLPASKDKTDGFYRRWCIIDFLNQFSEKKEILDDIPEKEYNNLAKKSLERVKIIVKERKLSNELSLLERKNKYEAHSNPLLEFIKLNCVVDVNTEIPCYEFYDAFEVFLKERGYRLLSKKEVTQRMDDEGFEQQRKWVKFDEEDKQWRHYIGVRLKSKHEVQKTVTDMTDMTLLSTYSPNREISRK